jgi:hypothetical protein
MMRTLPKKGVLVISLLFLSALLHCGLVYAFNLEIFEKNQTIIEEIERGIFSVSTKLASCSEVRKYKERIEGVSQESEEQHKSEAFQLGINLEAWLMLDICVGIMKKQNHPDYQLVTEWAMNYYKEMRRLQERVGIEDTSLIRLIGLDEPTWKAQTSSYADQTR